VRGSLSHGTVKHQAKHFFYAAGWKKFERLWHCVIRAKQLAVMTPVLEAVLSRVTRVEGPVLARASPAPRVTILAETSESVTGPSC